MTADAPTCRDQVDEPPGYWHTHTCGRRAKFVVTAPASGMDKATEAMPVCGTHANTWRRRAKYRDGVKIEALS